MPSLRLLPLALVAFAALWWGAQPAAAQEEAAAPATEVRVAARLLADGQVDRACYPSYGQVLADQIRGADAAEIDASEDEANRERLY